MTSTTRLLAPVLLSLCLGALWAAPVHAESDASGAAPTIGALHAQRQRTRKAKTGEG